MAGVDNKPAALFGDDNVDANVPDDGTMVFDAGETGVDGVDVAVVVGATIGGGGDVGGAGPGIFLAATNAAAKPPLGGCRDFGDTTGDVIGEPFTGDIVGEVRNTPL